MTMWKTAAGHQVLRNRSAGLSPRQRAALILFDGKRSLEDVLAATSPGGVTRADIGRLLELGLVAGEGQDSGPAPLTAPSETSSAQAAHERYLRAYKVAIQLTAELGPRGSGLHLAVEAAGTLEELRELGPRIRAAVLPLKFARFEAALNGH